MKQVASFSGGRTSAYMCKLLIDKFGRDNLEFIYQDTGAEHSQTYEFIRKVNQEFGLNLTCLRVRINPILGEGNGYDVVSIDDICHDLKPFKDIMSKYGAPYYPSGAFCSDMMKGNVSRQYLKDKYGKGNYSIWLGMRVDEPSRLTYLNLEKELDFFQEEIKEKNNKHNVRYLAEISDFDKQDILAWWAKQTFNLELENEVLGNCLFCIKKGVNKVALATRLEPELAQKFIEIVESDSVRKTEREMDSAIMYRGNHSLRSIIKMYEDFSDDDIMQTIRSMKREESGSCTESCEANFEFDFGEE